MKLTRGKCKTADPPPTQFQQDVDVVLILEKALKFDHTFVI